MTREEQKQIKLHRREGMELAARKIDKMVVAQSTTSARERILVMCEISEMIHKMAGFDP